MFSSPFVVCNRRIRLVLGRRRHQHAATSESMNFARKKSFRYLHLPHWHLERSKRRERYGKGARPRHIDSGQRLVSRLESGDRWDVLRSPARQPLARMHPVIASWMHLSTAAPRCGLAVQLLAYFATMSMFVVLPCDASKIPHVTTRLDGINRSLLADQEDGKTPSRSVRGIHETLQRTRSCVGCDLSALDLSASVLSGADLHGSILERTNLFHARLSGANLHAARLEESNLDEAALDGADLSAVNLKQATLRRTLLLGAHFDHNMLIEGADFSEAILDRADQRLLCELANGVNSQTGVSTFESLSCPSVKPSQVP
ncbi:hypothetical protein CCYA_CCYA02G0704 [Cyanidiococcus yangmingshanensis]|nr:hypothetical protein CCYA_CCYA02G0704 [Cyanidiococcus yangmingshanensis]